MDLHDKLLQRQKGWARAKRHPGKIAGCGFGEHKPSFAGFAPSNGCRANRMKVSSFRPVGLGAAILVAVSSKGLEGQAQGFRRRPHALVQSADGQAIPLGYRQVQGVSGPQA